VTLPPNLMQSELGVWGSVMPCWAVMVAAREAEPSMERGSGIACCGVADWVYPVEPSGSGLIVVGAPSFENGASTWSVEQLVPLPAD
jgi:hypothetical protein